MTSNQRIAAALLGKKPLGYEQIFVDGSVAVALTPAAYTNPKDRPYYAIIVVKAAVGSEGLNHLIRHLETGATPTASLGMLLGDGWIYELEGYDQIANFLAISASSDPLIQHEMNVTYYKLGDQ